jgi:predicted enzyme related to lactoylglutathione lyase
MLGESPAFSSFAVDDLDAARSFYGQTLGLTVEEVPMAPGLLELDIAGSRSVMIYLKPDFTPATYTVLNFPVDDVDAAVDGLVSAGVSMEHYEGFGQDDKGVARGDLGPPIAWFKDPAGNILAVMEQPDEPIT